MKEIHFYNAEMDKMSYTYGVIGGWDVSAVTNMVKDGICQIVVMQYAIHVHTQ